MKCLRIIPILLLALLLPAICFGQPAEENSALGFDIRVIYAEKSNSPYMTSELSMLRSDLASGFSDYSRFTLLQKSYHMTTPTQPAMLMLPNSPHSLLKLTYLKGDTPGLYNVQLFIDDQKISALQISEFATFFQAGIPYQDGILVVAITLSRIVHTDATDTVTP